MSKQIYLDAPNVGELEKEYLCKAVDSGYISTFGPFVSEFEDKFAAYLGVEKSVSTQSGTAALHMALYELGIGKGDEVIVPALTFIATANPITYVSATPVFVDVDADTWNVDSDEIEKNITEKTKAVIIVHLYGNPCDMEKMMKIREQYKVALIEDATESLGAKYKNKFTGTFGDFGCFSFNGNKVITTGGGGMIVGKDTKRLEHIKFLSSQARDGSDGFSHPEIGFNYRMTNIEAALGLAQLKRLAVFLARKKEFHKIYKDQLHKIGVGFQEAYETAESSYWLTCAIFKKDVNVPKLQRALKDKGIPTRRVFMPLTEFPPYKTYKNRDLRNSHYIYENSLCLPSSSLNSNEDVYHVCKVIKELLGQAKGVTQG